MILIKLTDGSELTTDKKFIDFFIDTNKVPSMFEMVTTEPEKTMVAINVNRIVKFTEVDEETK